MSKTRKREPKQRATPPNPLPCGCVVMGWRDLENAVETGYSLRVGWKNLHVAHCPLHAAAGDLLEICKLAAQLGKCDQREIGWCRKHDHPRHKGGPCAVGILVESACAVIAKLDGDSEPKPKGS